MEGDSALLEEAAVVWTYGVCASPPQDVGSVRNTAVECIGHLFAYLTKVEPTLGRWELGLMCMHACIHT